MLICKKAVLSFKIQVQKTDSSSSNCTTGHCWCVVSVIISPSIAKRCLPNPFKAHLTTISTTFLGQAQFRKRNIVNILWSTNILVLSFSLSDHKQQHHTHIALHTSIGKLTIMTLATAGPLQLNHDACMNEVMAAVEKRD